MSHTVCAASERPLAASPARRSTLHWSRMTWTAPMSLNVSSWHNSVMPTLRCRGCLSAESGPHTIDAGRQHAKQLPVLHVSASRLADRQLLSTDAPRLRRLHARFEGRDD